MDSNINRRLFGVYIAEFVYKTAKCLVAGTDIEDEYPESNIVYHLVTAFATTAEEAKMAAVRFGNDRAAALAMKSVAGGSHRSLTYLMNTLHPFGADYRVLGVVPEDDADLGEPIDDVIVNHRTAEGETGLSDYCLTTKGSLKDAILYLC